MNRNEKYIFTQIYIFENKTIKIAKYNVFRAFVVTSSGVNFIQKKLSKKSYPQISDVKNIIG